MSTLQITMNTLWSKPWHVFQKTCETFVGYILAAAVITLVLLAGMHVKERFLLQRGRAAPARLVSERKGQRGYLCVSYQFRDEAGRLVEGERGDLPRPGLTLRILADRDAAVRRNLAVLYDPKRPWLNLLFPPTTVTVKVPPGTDRPRHRPDFPDHRRVRAERGE